MTAKETYKSMQMQNNGRKMKASTSYTFKTNCYLNAQYTNDILMVISCCVDLKEALKQ